MKAFTVIAYALLFVVATTVFLLSFYVPIYIDELAWALDTSRAGYDGWTNIHQLPVCSNEFGTPIPLTLFPGRFLSWLAYYPISSPIALKLFGMGRSACQIGFLFWMSNQCFQTSKREILALIISLCFLGVLPFMSTLTRPEITLSIAVIFYALLPFYVARLSVIHNDDSKVQQNGKMAYIALLCTTLIISSLFFSAHPKSIFFFPLALYAMWAMRKPELTWFAACGLLLCTIFQSYQYWNYRFICPDSQWAHQIFTDSVLQPALLFANPFVFLHKLISAVREGTNYLESFLFMASHQTDWLPEKTAWLPAGTVNAVQIINGIIRWVISGVLLFWLVSLCQIAITACRKWAFLKPECAVPILLAGCLMLTAGFQQIKRFYDVMYLWYPGCCLTIILLTNSPIFTSKRIRNCLIVALGTVSVASQILLLHIFFELFGVNQQADVNGAVSEVTQSVLNYPEHRDRIIDFAAQCGIYPERSNSHLLIDMYTYMPFKESYQPIVVNDLEERMLQLAKEQHSSGLIALCRFLPENVQNISTKNNGLCCISQERINAVP